MPCSFHEHQTAPAPHSTPFPCPSPLVKSQTSPGIHSWCPPLPTPMWFLSLPLLTHPFPLLRVKVHLAFVLGVPLEDWWPAHTHTHTNKQTHYNAVQDTRSWGALHPNCRQWNGQIIVFSKSAHAHTHTHTHTCTHTHTHTHTHTSTHTHTHTHTKKNQDHPKTQQQQNRELTHKQMKSLASGLLESPELSFELREGRFYTLAGSEFQIDGAMKLKKCSPTDPFLFCFKHVFFFLRDLYNLHSSSTLHLGK